MVIGALVYCFKPKFNGLAWNLCRPVMINLSLTSTHWFFFNSFFKKMFLFFPNPWQRICPRSALKLCFGECFVWKIKDWEKMDSLPIVLPNEIHEFIFKSYHWISDKFKFKLFFRSITKSVRWTFALENQACNPFKFNILIRLPPIPISLHCLCKIITYRLIWSIFWPWPQL